ncbi:bifunctional hydroxymethylpyrimidine kinase/phosphomethylpyrimidine kinase [Gemmiger formicilis]|uniref:bifunctional hydroxymethylpyrimidine kinase/phosphomethylpyrimidine kinase n=1 Tax=Gemmiger formicilis TaxID=745368 RepID=UPI00195EA45A|nr:bifunctional hydroxymethylpyrimidine kinase/phosphomethylpyrimidine kinase [Gemmiger formicilis]MBM6900475.1 bifunctional hydroxymethylpyrimidine kinase/phosphomethylpyrimidine kinase [Gemmiger formicilis]
MRTALSIAGSDSSAGAGIQADLKAMTMNGVYGMTAITALTAQNTTGVTAISEVSPEFLAQQLDAVFTDIRPDAVKIGMVSSPALIETIAERLRFYQAVHIVVDPVMVATSGARLIRPEAVETLTRELLPLAEVVTPNIPEAELLAACTIDSPETMESAARVIRDRYGCAVLLKGGHCINDANDLLLDGSGARWFTGKRIATTNTHGTGCTLSSAIAANLAKGFALPESVQRAKDYLSGALAAGLDLGKGSGPMNHAWTLTGRYAEEAD